MNFLKFGFLHKYFSREELLKWSDGNLIANNNSGLFIDISSITKSDLDREIIEIFNKYSYLNDYDNFELYHKKFLSIIVKDINDWKTTQKRLVEYYDFFYGEQIHLFEKEYEFWIKLVDDFHLRKEGVKEGCMLMPDELNEYFNDTLDSSTALPAPQSLLT
ncbi:hypothetical protein [Aquimarina sp. 2201CG14-23]|uniref:hypothetical protein n=1 Tax=Aquimarina mycalae TaxID=3040073 RepID=UPI002477E274|nr:hypothetical protein [Aquimarina sp. 2201CG14-23]MDH7448036.1 hypothetical protein [Aquimarina sp. 2201CG14-23]